MRDHPADATPFLDWAVAARALPGEAASGDLHLVQTVPGGVLIAVVDGLGHGPEAALAAQTAMALLERHAHTPLAAMVEQCHQGLRQTRGVVMSLALLAPGGETLTWLAVGNVEGLLLRADPTARPQHVGLLLRGGVVGDQLPALQPTTVPLTPGDTLIFATDGVGSGFAPSRTTREPPQQMADRILAEHAKRTDDALVLVARYLGGRR